MKSKLFLFFIIICAFLVIGVEYLPLINPNLTNFQSSNLAPNFKHVFGTDFLGRDIFSRTIFGLKTSIIIGFFAGILTTILAFIYAGISQIFKISSVFEHIIDAFLAVPNILFIMIFSTITSGEILDMILVIAIFSWMSSAKVFITNIKVIKTSPYILQAKCFCDSKFKLLFFEILPNLKGLFLSLFAINIAHSMAYEATLSFFGMGGDLSLISLGLMLNESTSAVLMGSWWVGFFPGFVLFLVIFAIIYASSKLENQGIKV
ncbi:ABC transporter permease [Campylobacter corcagiensis]|uniref:ABC transporter permease n=1 Tax=Campylobacter corcagiensis TaxID=1448857 RepID=A0A7M1LHK6_9BACT|nr:ABC transporter permease [Campylobacter corcagiensis]QKF65349.1 nickel ABC transporter, permease protein [Campylobacter corcagiensis]QOQ88072.1 ABC transporter permease [Campylobacter corcagiensis]